MKSLKYIIVLGIVTGVTFSSCEDWLDPKWELVAQMPFGTPTEEPGPKEIKPLDKRVLVFK